MARINIEDSLWSDPRFMRLCIALTDEMRAVGAVVLAWRTAQKFWCPSRQPIPMQDFEAAGLPFALIDCGLAEQIGDGIRMKGSDEHFAWWFQRQAAGRAGGLASGTKRSLSGRQRSSSGTKQNEPSSSSSISSSKELNTIAQPTVERPKFNFDQIYQKYPRKQGKSEGLKRAKAQIKTQVDFDALSSAIDRFNAHHRALGTEAEFIPYFSTFMSSWRDWLDPETGRITPAAKLIDPSKQAALDEIQREHEEWRRQSEEESYESA